MYSAYIHVIQLHVYLCLFFSTMIDNFSKEFALHHHRPNIVSIIMERSHQLHASTQLISQHDEVWITLES